MSAPPGSGDWSTVIAEWPPFSIDALVDAQRAADRAGCDRAPNATALRKRANWLRGLDAMHNWTYHNLIATEAEIDEMAVRMSIGYGIPVSDLREVAMRLLRDAALNA